jgi:DMSO/TMAO reductase YedYZ molybdopterin-dependent catalytic subunit
MSEAGSRRRWIGGALAAAGGLAGGAGLVAEARRHSLIPPDATGPCAAGTALTYGVQRWLLGDTPAREFPRDRISKKPFANGKPPSIGAFKKHQASGFADWRLVVEGKVAKARAFSLAELKNMPPSSQITEVACEEGWSYIAEWIGTPLSAVLAAVGMDYGARWVVYRSIEEDWWDSLDLADARHPQTLLAYGFNGGELPVEFGGPIRMRVPRQLAYKSVKYIDRVIITDDIRKFGKGLGSASPEAGYSWYAGI